MYFHCTCTVVRDRGAPWNARAHRSKRRSPVVHGPRGQKPKMVASRHTAIIAHTPQLHSTRRLPFLRARAWIWPAPPNYTPQTGVCLPAIHEKNQKLFTPSHQFCGTCIK